MWNQFHRGEGISAAARGPRETRPGGEPLSQYWERADCRNMNFRNVWHGVCPCVN